MPHQPRKSCQLNSIALCLSTLIATTAVLTQRNLQAAGPKPSSSKHNPAALSGGDTTVFVTSRHAFSKSLANLPIEKLRDFAFGDRMFTTNWVTAPASVKSLDGLGPLFNRVSCSACHVRDGRGRPPVPGETKLKSMLFRLSIPGKAPDGGPKPHPTYGGQLQDRAIQSIQPEAAVIITYTTIHGKYADGTTYTLRKPNYQFTNLAYGPIGLNTLYSPRVAPPVHGLGLLETVSQKAILALADPNDKNKDGISGRPNYVWDAVNKKHSLGRFGWKANQPSLLQQAAGAANGDIGITTNLLPKDHVTSTQARHIKSPDGGNPEMSDAQLKKLVFYLRTLAVPAQRNVNDKTVKRGRALFTSIGCASCHTPQLKTARHPSIPQLSNQTIYPYTNLLLHDMGEQLADNRPDYKATGREWRTPPLWGIGLTKTVNGHTFFLHDGRARNLTEAILWHAGEAANSQKQFVNLPQPDRHALIRFLNSL